MEEPAENSSPDGEFDENDEDDFYDDDGEGDGKALDEAGKYKARLESKNKADSLLYDAKEDLKNSNWVEKNMKKPKGRKSDAVLLCPCCFTPLCYDCQRHATYRNQYRAMFVVNCEVDKNQILKFGKGEKMRKSKIFDPIQDEIYHPTTCTGCNTEVAVMDRDEVYHFFNIIPSDS